MKKLASLFHYFFIPQEENNFRAKVLHIDFLTYYLLFALVLSFSFNKFNFPNVLGFATDITVEKLYQLTDQERQKNNLPTLTYNDKLASAAHQKAEDMFRKNYWSHYAPDGTTPWDFILGSGYKYEYAGENLAKNFLFSQGVVDAWMNSPSHRENILRSEYSEVGLAVVNGVLNGEQTTLVVQTFAKPLSSTMATTNNPHPVEKVQNNTQFLTSSSSNVLANASAKKFTLANFTLDINFLFLIFLAFALIMDLYFSVRLNIIRIRGKNIAHLIFIGFIILGLVLFSRGTIL
ncbi:hypothetical protein COS31_05260 [Candidatus Roizmanbacteria bacterium CG02_land_8_20_14_3_00_36_15]|uniref:SCP domain-containing protein n=3 Tax=Candidatus Roizmaniibacteriota TaxID=1752723 RepID=A0A2H0BYS3_9BACT|nr:MAG: hypothetical protein COW98_02280 [Candidatus Roizmanbacteria bacterium CG22_combo_CG10-13_8_21_14_all_35_9]PIV09558.1 MAG: hypothetical protein COS51_02460 [Candidatus Roizmanbacteria bacterium CG03_land_8_20_14_0_80_36_21]PIV37340.1 MAG: hypothetical protein COS31_05260 [Candidatus Roizmanbacteria bacterium CG02_land_8_20_14_3_00_36_15]PIY69762.1 MAG: hypothetical protein COY89_04580 [Candidatus Roizmanbacteria bacterium CG_4_10_14_0_8_um_filter_36_36]PJA53169.1 MAG: hypothetical prote